LFIYVFQKLCHEFHHEQPQSKVSNGYQAAFGPNHLRDRPIRNTIRNITTNTMIIPTHTPALKISPMAWQLESVTNRNAHITYNDCFIKLI